jgi:hypothetical protein
MFLAAEGLEMDSVTWSLAGVPTPLRYMSIDHADEKYSIGQRRDLGSGLLP